VSSDNFKKYSSKECACSYLSHELVQSLESQCAQQLQRPQHSPCSLSLWQQEHWCYTQRIHCLLFVCLTSVHSYILQSVVVSCATLVDQAEGATDYAHCTKHQDNHVCMHSYRFERYVYTCFMAVMHKIINAATIQGVYIKCRRTDLRTKSSSSAQQSLQAQ
jgi:hypothetical protein